VAGFVTAVTDGVLAAYIPLLEVRPEWRGQGIGTELMRRILDRLSGLYMIDLVCDPGLLPFYARLGLQPYSAAIRRGRAALAR
jgi:GNAT superfamily N-acetyltransferase